MEKQSRKRKTPSLVRWIFWVLLVQFILFNISAALYAYKFTHLNDDPALRNKSQGHNIFVKTWRLYQRTQAAQIRNNIIAPVFNYDTITLKTEKGIYH
jgi:hypothetical protein